MKTMKSKKGIAKNIVLFLEKQLLPITMVTQRKQKDGNRNDLSMKKKKTRLKTVYKGLGLDHSTTSRITPHSSHNTHHTTNFTNFYKFIS